MDNTALDAILATVEKPARYTGGEWNMVMKQSALVHVALCFPDIYEIGMSHLGSRILYHVLNEREGYSVNAHSRPGRIWNRRFATRSCLYSRLKASGARRI